ncbi:hypothetical protein DH2020_038262 [Rehmannia glutinosa]|uniref:Protein LURP-one-related 5-like n=1 Tax=Rehmannia glutinosa TaxID=99300 RepID=A0ABR0UZF9_REHGL
MNTTTVGAIVEEGFVYTQETHLTVLKSSLFFAGDGFAAYDSNGAVVFRVDSYGRESGDTGELVLMDAAGRCLLTVRRKWPSLHHRWEGFAGERISEQTPLFSVHRSSMIGRSSMAVEVYTKPGEEYQIDGSFGLRKCTILNADREAVAEIRRKVDSYANLELGKEVFLLSLKPGFDGAFAMGLVLILDQIQGANYEDDDGVVNWADSEPPSPTMLGAHLASSGPFGSEIGPGMTGSSPRISPMG